MPLKRGGKKAVSFNIRELTHTNTSKPAGKKRSRAQIIAIGISAAKRGKK